MPELFPDSCRGSPVKAERSRADCLHPGHRASRQQFADQMLTARGMPAPVIGKHQKWR